MLKPTPVILSEAKNLCSFFLALQDVFAATTRSELQRSFASLRMTTYGLRMTTYGLRMTPNGLRITDPQLKAGN
jgi:hypothetical protein